MISIEGLKVEFGTTPLFEDVSFVINKKDRIALVGKNGAGKSTLLNIIGGIDSADSGYISINGDKLEELAKEMGKEFDVEKRSELGIQMQQTVLDDNAYVFCSHLKMSMIMQSNVTGLVAHPCDYYELTADLDIN